VRRRIFINLLTEWTRNGGQISGEGRLGGASPGPTRPIPQDAWRDRRDRFGRYANGPVAVDFTAGHIWVNIRVLETLDSCA
jgi:hypothetical protein